MNHNAPPPLERPRFLPSALEQLRQEASLTGWRSVVPVWFIAFAVLGAVAAYAVPDVFWDSGRWDVSTAVYAGLLTFNGLVLALGWAAFARMYDVLLRPGFGNYIYKAGLMNDYIVQISFMNIIKVFAISFSAIGLLSVLIENPYIIIDRIIFALVVCLTAYEIKQATDAVSAMNDLVWQANVYESYQSSKESGANVTGIRPR